MVFVREINLKDVALLGLLLLVVACVDDKAPVGRMPPTLSLGEPAPDFIFRSLTGVEDANEKLSQQRGKVIYLDFWASWCKPCRTSMPLLDQLRSELKAQGFEVIAVNLDDDLEKGQKFLINHPVNYPVVRVADGTITTDTISDLYQIYGLPTSYIIDKQGVLRYVHQGFKEQDIKKIRHQILTLLK